MDLGLPEILVIVVIALLLFGPSKLPGLGKSMGEAIRGFKKGLKDINDPEEPTQTTGRGPIITPAPQPKNETTLIPEPKNSSQAFQTEATKKSNQNSNEES